MDKVIHSKGKKIINILMAFVLTVGLAPTALFSSTQQALAAPADDSGSSPAQTSLTVSYVGDGSITLTNPDDTTTVLEDGDTETLTFDTGTYSHVVGAVSEDTTHIYRATSEGLLLPDSAFDTFTGQSFETDFTYDGVDQEILIDNTGSYNPEDISTYIVADDGQDYYVGKKFTGTCQIKTINGGTGHTVHYVDLNGFTGVLSGKTVRAYCYDHGAAAPDPSQGRTWAWTWTITSINQDTGVITGSLMCDGYPSNQSHADNYQRLHCSTTITKTFGGYIDLQKESGNKSITDGNDCYSFKDAVYGIYKTKSEADAATTDAPGRPVAKLTTDSNGYAKSDRLNVGTYYVKELEAPKGYALDSQTYPATVSGGKTVRVTSSDYPQYDPIDALIHKYDGEKKYSGEELLLADEMNTPLAGASLEGAVFSFEYYDGYYSTVAAAEESGEPTYTYYFATDKDGYVGFSPDYLAAGYESSDFIKLDDVTYALPLGTVVIKEILPSKGYLLPTELSWNGEYVVQITGKTSPDEAAVDTFNAPIQKEPVKRGDFDLTKQNEDNKQLMAGIPFKITSVTTGQSHIVVTDENGYYSSASNYNKHSYKTNGNDDYSYGSAESPDLLSSIVNTLTGSDSSDEKTELDNTCGLWFSGDTSLDDTNGLDDTRGALPYDTYTIEELECDSNQGMSLYKGTFTISRDSGTSLFVTHLGTITNTHTEITDTNLSNQINGAKMVTKDDTVTVVDKVAYDGLLSGETYTLTGTLMDKSTSKAITDENGDVIQVTKTFTPNSKSGTVEMEFTFDATVIEDGGQVVAFEQLNLGENVMASEADLGNTNQTVTIVNPPLHTTATDKVDGDKNVVIDPETEVVDEVAYEDLVIGKTYTVSGTLHVKNIDEDGNITDGGVLKDADGNDVTASTTFTADKKAGKVKITFKFDSTLLKDGDQTVAFEELKTNGKTIATHADIEDEGQTVEYIIPKISTTAVDGADGDKKVVTDPEATIVDAVHYKNLVPNKEYTITGTLHLKNIDESGNVTDGGELKDKDGKVVTVTEKFTPTKSEDDYKMTFTFDTSSLNGKDVVVFEDLARNGKSITAHADITDEGQTVTSIIPEISTTAVDGADGDKSVVTDPEATIVDTVHYKNLVPNKEYTITGTLHLKNIDESGNVTDGGELKDKDGNVVTVSEKFTPTKSEDDYKMTFTFDTSSLNGKDVVVFEDLARNGKSITAHAEITDEGQTVTVEKPPVETTATDQIDGDHSVVADETATIVDTVAYDKLLVGKEYTVTGTLMVKSTGEALLDADGNPVTASTTFTPTEAKGSVDVVFKFNSELLSGKTLVAFEKLYREQIEVATHEDINDEGQSVKVVPPTLHTTATDTADGDKNVTNDPESSITDTVEYSNVEPNEELTVVGILMDKSTGLPLLTGEGKDDITTEQLQTFVDKLKEACNMVGNQTVAKDITIDALGYSGTVNILSNVTVAKNDDGSYKLTTSGAVAADLAKISDGEVFAVSDADGNVTIAKVDKVTNVSLIPASGESTDGKTETTATTAYYTFTGTVIDGEAASTIYQQVIEPLVGSIDMPVAPDYEALTKLMEENADLVDHLSIQKQTFTPEQGEGSIDMVFPVNSLYNQDTNSVVYEFMFKKGETTGTTKMIAQHADLEDEGQTISFVTSKIKTEATDKTDGDHEILPSTEACIVDTVTYTGLIPGKEYTISGTLMDKSTGEALIVGDSKVTAEKTFTPNKADGEVQLEFTFDASSLSDMDIVVFEKLYKDGIEITSHEDINDEGQTVHVPTGDQPGGSTPDGSGYDKTGVDLMWVYALITLLIAGAGGAGAYYLRQRKLAAIEGNVTVESETEEQ